jgi:hypothetical protein
MAPARKPSLTPLQTTVLYGQLIGITIGLGLYVTDIGRKTATLDRIGTDVQELRVIAADLTKAVIRGQSIDEKHTEAILALTVKIDRYTVK